MTQQELNEKLAELCGYGEVRTPSGQLTSYHDGNDVVMHRTEWNPCQDLNQLKMCYETARLDVGSTAICEHLEELVGGLCDMGDALNVLCDKPELVAQAILNAKEGK